MLRYLFVIPVIMHCIDVFIASGLIVNALQLVTACIIWPVSKQLYRSINAPLVRLHWDQLIWLVDWFAGVKVRIFGDPEYYKRYCGKEPMICICNHKSDVDWLLGWCFAHRFSSLGLTKCLMKKTNAYIPVVGWTWWFMEYIFLDRNWAKDQATLTKAFESLNNFGLPFWMVTYAEGTRYTAAKNEEARAFARSRGFYEPKHTLCARAKGFVITTQSLRKTVKSIACTTFAFPKGKQPTILSMLMGMGGEVHMLVRRFDVTTLPEDDEGLSTWLRNVWTEKDQMLTDFEEHDQYIVSKHTPENMQEIDVPRRFVSMIIMLSWALLFAIWLYNKLVYCFTTGHYGFLYGYFVYKTVVILMIIFFVVWSKPRQTQATMKAEKEAKEEHEEKKKS